MYRFLVVIEKGENNYSAYSPDLPGCVATGSTQEETIENMKQAIQFHLEGCADTPQSKAIFSQLVYV